MPNKVCVLGAGSTKYGKLNEGIIEIALKASIDAIDFTGITPKDIQAGYISNVFGVTDRQVHMAPVIMSNLGVPEVPGLTIESACGSGSIMFREAYANVAAGFYDCILGLGVEKITHTGTIQSILYSLIVQISFTKAEMVRRSQDYSRQLLGHIWLNIKRARKTSHALQ